MSDNKKKRFKKIKGNNLWITIIAFVLIAVVFENLFVFTVKSFSLYIVESRFISEYDIVNVMTNMYDNNSDDADKAYKMLDEGNRDYIVCDKSGKILHSKGENTCSDEGALIRTSQSKEEIQVYKDSERGYVYPEDDKLALDFLSFRDWISEDVVDESSITMEAHEMDDDIESGISFVQDSELISLPIWIAVDLDGGEKVLKVKALLNSNAGDIILLVEIVGIMAIIVVAILIYMLVKAIMSFVRQRRLIRLFYTDPVTGGSNWMWYLYKGERTLRKRSSAGKSFALIDLTFVNYRNFCVCHSVSEGEELLKRVYNLIISDMNKKEICAHISSANFAILIGFDNEEELKYRINNMFRRLEKTDEHHKLCFQAGITYVVPVINSKGKAVRRKYINIEEEYNKACTASATLTDSMESQFAFFDDRLIEEQKWMDIVHENQERALANEEFVVYYQPKYDPVTNELKGAEALIRWVSPIFGFVSPGKFIPLFEKNGFITEIDHYMITHVARDQKMWLDKGMKCVPVSVNVSRAHFIESELAEQIRDMVDAEGIPHDLIEIELTESAFFDDKNAMIETINRLKGYGFSVSMDDFGSGYSSLNSLKDMPLDVLKLDAEFFRGKNEDNRGEIIVSEAIRLARSLNMRTVAEGVEIKEQVDFLASEGCDMIQGFYFAKPMPKEEFEGRMKS